MALERWQAFFREVLSLVTAGERHYGVCNANYSDYMIERFELSIQSCETIVNGLSVLSNAERAITEYKEYIDQLIELLRILLDQWKDYRTLLGSNLQHTSYCVPIQCTSSRGRPKFDIDREQLEYLVSLSFKWSDIAALLGISRTTLYRYTLCGYIRSYMRYSHSAQYNLFIQVVAPIIIMLYNPIFISNCHERYSSMHDY